MELSLAEAARVLGVSEHALYWWSRRGEAPGHMVGDRYRFHEVELLEWAARRNLPARPRPVVPVGTSHPGLGQALDRGGIHRALPGIERAAVLAALVEKLPLPDPGRKPLLLSLLTSREELGATAIGNGLALPHPRQPLLLGRGEPFAALGLLASPVDFGAPDGQPVRAMLLLICFTVREHLELLGRAARAFSDPALRALVLEAGPDREILARLAELEAADAAEVAQGPIEIPESPRP